MEEAAGTVLSPSVAFFCNSLFKKNLHTLADIMISTTGGDGAHAALVHRGCF